MSAGVTRTWNTDIVDTPFSFVGRKIVEFSHDPEVTRELDKLKTGVERCGDVLQISNSKLDKAPKSTSTLFDSAKDVMYTLLIDRSVEADFKATLNAALIFNSNFPVKMYDNIQPLDKTLRYGDISSDLLDDIYLAGKILSDPLHSEYFVPTSAGSPRGCRNWVAVIPNFEFDVKKEFNLIRLIYAFSRDVFTTYKDEIFESDSHHFHGVTPNRLKSLHPHCCRLLANLVDTKSLEYGLRKMQENGKVPQIKSNHLIGLMKEVDQRLLSLNVGHNVVRECEAYKLNRVLTDAEMQFLPICLHLLEPIADIKMSESVMLDDIKIFRELSESASDLYAFKVNKLESALIALNRLHMFRETILRPCEVKPFTPMHALEAKVNHMESQFALESQTHEAELLKYRAELKERGEEIERLKAEVQMGDMKFERLRVQIQMGNLEFGKIKLQMQKREMEFDLMKQQISKLIEQVNLNK